MISVASVTDKYILQPTVLAKHKKTLEWLSAAMLWKRELTFFQKLLDMYAPRFSSLEDKMMIDHFQSIFIYYSGELVDGLVSKLRNHEKLLGEALQENDETKTGYFKEHDHLMNEMESVRDQFIQYKEEFFGFIERVI
ncbi:MAG TPA: hypothetical protein VIM75_24610 [Ohtaekwangia sp.]|uniref:hypothetical protein n=1 Tax=Ohtaekwangia sp. TaxID=2066019 RepID=UPI002F950F1E